MCGLYLTFFSISYYRRVHPFQLGIRRRKGLPEDPLHAEIIAQQDDCSARANQNERVQLPDGEAKLL